MQRLTDNPADLARACGIRAEQCARRAAELRRELGDDGPRQIGPADLEDDPGAFTEHCGRIYYTAGNGERREIGAFEPWPWPDAWTIRHARAALAGKTAGTWAQLTGTLFAKATTTDDGRDALAIYNVRR